MTKSLTICVLFASLLSQQLFASVASIRLEDKKTYYSPPDPNTGSPPDGTPPSQGGYTPTPSTPSTTPPSNNCGSPPYDPSLSPPSHTPSRPSTPSHTPTPSRPSHTPTPSRPSHTPTPSHTPHTPPPCNCGSPPYDPTPSTPTPSTPFTPTPSTPFTPTPSTPSTPSNPPSGGYYSSPPPSTPIVDTPPSTPIVDTPPTPIIGESPPTPILDPGTPIIGGSPPTPYLDPGTPGTPFVPAPFPPFTGTCDYWRNHPTLIWGLVGWWGTVGGAFGTLSTPSSIPGFDPHMNLLQALSNSRTDAIGALYREGTASWLNSMANNRFPFTTPQVRDHFLAGLSSTKAATKQAHTFKLANEGRLKPRI